MQRFLAVAAAALVTVAACDNRSATSITGSSDADATRLSPAAAPATPQVIAGGLEYPRGFAFGPDGAIYLAEAGTPEGNTTMTVGLCPQVGFGPSAGGFTSRISRITLDGTRTTVADHLPSAINALGDVEGVSDIAFGAGHKMYALLPAGCAHGHLNEPSAVLGIHADGSYDVLADLSRWVKANPTAHPNPGDFEPDGDFYNMAAQGNVLYVVEANQGNLLSVKPEDGKITRLADVSATEGHRVPTGLAIADGDLLVGELTPFPAVTGAADILRYKRNGEIRDRVHGFTAVLGVATDKAGTMYVLESFTCPTADPCFPSPGSGRVMRVSPDGTRDVIATGLSFPTALRMGPDGALYVANFGYGMPGMGQILRIVP